MGQEKMHKAKTPFWIQISFHNLIITMADMCDIYISEIKANLRRADELIAQGRADNDCKEGNLKSIYSIFCKRV